MVVKLGAILELFHLVTTIIIFVFMTFFNGQIAFIVVNAANDVAVVSLMVVLVIVDVVVNMSLLRMFFYCYRLFSLWNDCG